MKVKAKIAVAIDASGEWHASGWSSSDKDYESSAIGCCIDSLASGERRYWIEVELETPEVTTIQAEATPA